MPAKATLRRAKDLLVCKACGTQFPNKEDSGKDECKICDDPRQYVPPEGQLFTTLAQLEKDGHRNVWWQDQVDERVWCVKTEPSFAIGQRAELICTEGGNILWDLIPFLDQETVDKITSLGGLDAIVISHPHYYATWADWSRTFSCPVYIGAPDKEWLERLDTPGADMRYLTETYTPILPDRVQGMTAILAGGHFPGSLLLHWEGILFIADTIFMSPSATNPVPGKPGVISFTFFWSIPNRIPLHPDDILMIWEKVKSLDFHTCYGAFQGQDIRTMDNEKKRGTGSVKGSKIYVSAMGWKDGQHGIFTATL